MYRHLVILRRISFAALAVCASAVAINAGSSSATQATASPQSTASTAEQLSICAARDLELIILLEERGSKAASQKLDRAFRDIARARAACAEGNWTEASRIYDAATLLLKAE